MILYDLHLDPIPQYFGIIILEILKTNQKSSIPFVPLPGYD